MIAHLLLANAPQRLVARTRANDGKPRDEMQHPAYWREGTLRGQLRFNNLIGPYATKRDILSGLFLRCLSKNPSKRTAYAALQDLIQSTVNATGFPRVGAREANGVIYTFLTARTREQSARKVSI